MNHKQLNILSVRKKVNITQIELSKKTGIARAVISRIETGKTIPLADKLPVIAAALDCRIDDLFTEEELDAKASAQTLLPDAPADDTPPWEEDDDSLDGLLE